MIRVMQQKPSRFAPTCGTFLLVLGLFGTLLACYLGYGSMRNARTVFQEQSALMLTGVVILAVVVVLVVPALFLLTRRRG